MSSKREDAAVLLSLNPPALNKPTFPELHTVPATIRKKGLSAVVNHLLDRKVPTDGENSPDSDDDSDEEERLPAIPFDFLLNDRLLRLPLDSAARKEGLSTEHALELQYFPARLPPRREDESETLPDWITSMSFCSGSKNDEGVLFTGGADGAIRSFFSHDGRLQPVVTASCHTSPIKCLSTIQQSDANTLVATGSLDQTLITHTCKGGAMKLHALYSGGHTNSIGSVAMKNDGGETLMSSGDWDGGLSLWRIPGVSAESNDENATALTKKSKGNRGSANSSSVAKLQEVKPLHSIKAHSSSISGLEFGFESPTKLLTGGWDHGLKVYDTNRMDCILTLNGSRVITSLSRCSNSDVVATSSPDCAVRLWDLRTGAGESGNVKTMDKSLRQSHKGAYVAMRGQLAEIFSTVGLSHLGWVSSVQWSPNDPFVLASASHDGSLKVWDIRSTTPLHSVRAVKKKGEKALCLAFGHDMVYTGGSDCVVSQFACKI